MKKTPSIKLDPSKTKLSLRKELVRELQPQDLQQVVGGYRMYTRGTC